METSSIAVESPPGAETEPASRRHESFDFRNPGHSVREGIRRLESAHEAFAARLERSLSDSFGVSVHLELEGIEQYTFDRYLAELPSPGVLALVSLDPFPGTAVFELSAGAGLLLVEAMLGGASQTVLDRAPSDLERRLLQGVSESAVGSLAEALRPIGLGVTVQTWDVDPQFTDVGSGELAILVHYGLAFGEDGEPHDRLVLAYPLAALQAIAEGRLEIAPDGDPDGSGSRPRWIAAHLPDVPVPFAVHLQPSDVSFLDLAALQPGDVLRLDHAIEDPVIGLVDGLPLVMGRLGVVKNKLALEIAGWLEHD